MNMISTGAFLPEMDASNKQETMAEKFARVWEKKNSKVARAGGVSLMALSLAACGSSSDDTDTDTDTDTGTNTGSTTTVTPAALALTDANNIFDADDFTTAADTVSADQDTYGSNDVIAEPNAGDGDTLTIATDADITATPTIVGVENIVVNSSQFTAANDGINFAADGITGGTITLNNVQVGSASATATATTLGSVTVVAGTNVTTLNVSQAEDASATVNAGSATALQYTTIAGDDQVATVIVNGDLALETVDTAGSLTDVNITATVASEVTLTDTGTNVDTITGDANTTIVAAGDLSDFNTYTITGVATVSGGGATADLTDVAAGILISDGAAAALTVASGVNVEADTALAGATTISLIAEDDADVDTAAALSATVTLSADTTDDGDGAGGYSVTLTDDATDGDEEITTLNLVISGDLDHDALTTGATAEGDLELILTDNETATTVNISGSGDLDLLTSTDAANEITLNGASMTGALDYIQTTGVGVINSGSGDDTLVIGADDAAVNTGAGDDEVILTAAATTAITLNGGDGSDTFSLSDGGGAADIDLSDVTLTGFEILNLTDSADFVASQISGATYVVADGAGAIEIDATASVDIASIDLSQMTFASAADVVRVDLTQIAGNLTANTAFTYLGSGGADTVTGSANADNISGGAGIDTLDGNGGADTLTGGAAADFFVINTGDSTEAAMDVITDFQSSATVRDTITLDGGAAGSLSVGANVAANNVNLGTADADGNLAAADVTAVVANGILTLDGDTADKAVIDTLAEWIDAATLVLESYDNAVGGAVSEEHVIAFELGGNTYVVSAIDADEGTASDVTVNDVICLEGVVDQVAVVTAAATDSILIA